MEDRGPFDFGRPKLEEAIMMVNRAVHIANEVEAQSGDPTDMDVTLLGRLCETLWSHYFMANFILGRVCKKASAGYEKRRVPRKTGR
jgi:hypothetical protein